MSHPLVLHFRPFSWASLTRSSQARSRCTRQCNHLSTKLDDFFLIASTLQIPSERKLVQLGLLKSKSQTGASESAVINDTYVHSDGQAMKLHVKDVHFITRISSGCDKDRLLARKAGWSQVWTQWYLSCDDDGQTRIKPRYEIDVPWRHIRSRSFCKFQSSGNTLCCPNMPHQLFDD